MIADELGFINAIGICNHGHNCITSDSLIKVSLIVSFYCGIGFKIFILAQAIDLDRIGFLSSHLILAGKQATCYWL